MTARALISLALFSALALPASDGARAEGNEAPIVAVFAIEDSRPPKTRLPAGELQNLTDYLATKVASGGAFKIIPNAQLRTALMEKKKESYKACYESSCQIEIGKEVAAQKSLSTKIMLVGKQCIIVSTLYDLREAASEKTADAEGACDSASLADGLKKIAAKLEGRSEAPRGTAASGSAGAPSGPSAGRVDTNGYDDLAKEAEAARKDEERKNKEREKRLEDLEKAWSSVKLLADRDNVPAKRRVEVLQKFLRDFADENPHRGEAEAMVVALEAGESGMVTVPAGSFHMGCNTDVDSECEDDEKPGREVTLPAYAIDRHEVTVEEYARCVNEKGCSADGLTMPRWDDRDQAEWVDYCNWGKSGRAKHPVNCISWAQAKAYCAKYGKRLPSEAEWEKAARGTDGRKYPWGNAGYGSAGRVANIADNSAKAKFTALEIAYSYDDGFVGTAPVESFAEGKSPYGAYDMLGNIAEYTADWYKDGQITIRGGSCYLVAKSTRASYRDWVRPPDRRVFVGFRCAR